MRKKKDSRVRRISRRFFPRAPVGLKIAYRTTGAFLMNYTTNISRGGLFVETDDPSPEGTRVAIRLNVPGIEHDLETTAVVVWSRDDETSEGPAGMGMRFEVLDEKLEKAVDSLVGSFSGLAIGVVAGNSTALAQTTRIVRGVLSCRIVEIDARQIPSTGIHAKLDLAIIDLHSCGRHAQETINALQETRAPVIALSGSTRLRDAAVASGVDEVLVASPSMPELRAALLKNLGRPSVTKT